MGQRLAEAARYIVSQQGVPAFSSTWQILFRRVQHRFFWLDPSQIEDALGDVILRLLSQDTREEEKTPPGEVELSLHSLYGMVCRRLADELRADRRRRRREWEHSRQKKKWLENDFLVQNGLLAAPICIGGNYREEVLDKVIGLYSERDQAFVALRKQGIKETSAYAEVLGIVHCSREEQRRAVRRFWNRIRMKLRRLVANRAKLDNDF